MVRCDTVAAPPLACPTLPMAVTPLLTQLSTHLASESRLLSARLEAALCMRFCHLNGSTLHSPTRAILAHRRTPRRFTSTAVRWHRRRRQSPSVPAAPSQPAPRSRRTLLSGALQTTTPLSATRRREQTTVFAPWMQSAASALESCACTRARCRQAMSHSTFTSRMPSTTPACPLRRRRHPARRRHSLHSSAGCSTMQTMRLHRLAIRLLCSQRRRLACPMPAPPGTARNLTGAHGPSALQFSCCRAM